LEGITPITPVYSKLFFPHRVNELYNILKEDADPSPLFSYQRRTSSPQRDTCQVLPVRCSPEVFPAVIKQLRSNMLHPDIRELTLDFMDGEGFNDECMRALLESMPLALDKLSVDFSGYSILKFADALVSPLTDSLSFSSELVQWS
jgi:hypothetical protein